jgi:hypothetical protein
MDGPRRTAAAFDLKSVIGRPTPPPPNQTFAALSDGTPMCQTAG